MTPLARSKSKLESEGWTVAIVERWNGFARVRQDLFEFGDLLAFNGDTVAIIQATTSDHVANRMHKVQRIAAASLWLASPHRAIVVHGWAKRGPRGGAKVWTCREVRVDRPETISAASVAAVERENKTYDRKSNTSVAGPAFGGARLSTSE